MPIHYTIEVNGDLLIVTTHGKDESLEEVNLS